MMKEGKGIGLGEKRQKEETRREDPDLFAAVVSSLFYCMNC